MNQASTPLLSRPVGGNGFSISVIILPVLAIGVLLLGLFRPLTLTAVVCTLLVVISVRRPLWMIAAAIVVIPIVDQWFSTIDSEPLFGSFRINPQAVIKGMIVAVIVGHLMLTSTNPLRIRVLRPVAYFLIYLLLSCLLFHDPAVALSIWMRVSYWLLLLIFFYSAASSADSFTDISRFWVAGMVSLAVLGVSVEMARVLGVGGEFYGVGESYGFYQDPWEVALSLPVGLVMPLLFCLVLKRSRLTALLCTGLVALTLLAGFHTFTRTFVVSCLIVVLLFGLSLKRMLSGKAWIVACVCLALVIGVPYSLYTQVSSDSSQVSQRWADVSGEQAGSGRLLVWLAGWQRFAGASLGRKVFGFGPGAGPEAVESFLGIPPVHLHNDLLETLVSAGLTGLALYLWMFIRMYKSAFGALLRGSPWGGAAFLGLVAYSVSSLTYMRMYAVTPNTYFALILGTSLGIIQRQNPQTGANAMG
jgi:O-antigen ligase